LLDQAFGGAFGHAGSRAQQEQRPALARGAPGDQRRAIGPGDALRQAVAQVARRKQQPDAIRDAQIRRPKNVHELRVVLGDHDELRADGANLVEPIARRDPPGYAVQHALERRRVDGHTQNSDSRLGSGFDAHVTWLVVYAMKTTL